VKEILIGTHNRHKAREISELLSDLGITVRTLNDFPGVPETDEDGKTLEENAVKKAREYAQATGLLTLSDDTGLEVDALNGAPGVYSARYAGEDCSFEDNNRKLLKELQGVPSAQRTARFRCVIACFDPADGKMSTVEGAVQGSIVEDLQGRNGFGYDPVFFVPELGKTLAELTLEEKNRISHRGQAIRKAKELLKGMK
jgi:XTP/dITP diphosphohydrolase